MKHPPHKKELSSFLEVVNNFFSSTKDKKKLSNAVYGVEIFLYKYPKYLCAFVRKSISNYSEIKKKTGFDIYNLIYPIGITSNYNAIGAIRNLIDSLTEKGGLTVYILHDGAIIHECLLAKYGRLVLSFCIKISRKELGFGKAESLSRYLKLFSIINNTLRNRQVYDWNTFLDIYGAGVEKLTKEDKIFFDFLHIIITEIDNKIPKNKLDVDIPVTVVDTGLQGTFAILCCWLMKKYKLFTNVDFRLVSCYPWMPEYFQKRSFLPYLKDFSTVENSIINTHSRNLEMFGRVISPTRTLQQEREKLKKLLNAL